MKRYLLSFSVLLFVFINPVPSFAIEGACSSHGGVNCGAGPINSYAVCYDGWISSVFYSDMVECEGYESQCTVYLNEDMYAFNRNVVKQKIDVLKNEILDIQYSISMLPYEKEQAKDDLQKSYTGRGATHAGIQPSLNEIDREYSQKETDLNIQLLEKQKEYNEILTEYNGYCRKYSFDYKDDICKKNYGNTYSYNGIQKICWETKKETVVTPPNQTQLDISVKDPDEICRIQKGNSNAYFQHSRGLCIICEEGQYLDNDKDMCMAKEGSIALPASTATAKNSDVHSSSSSSPVISRPEVISDSISSQDSKKEESSDTDILMDVESVKGVDVEETEKQEEPKKSFFGRVISSIGSWFENIFSFF